MKNKLGHNSNLSEQQLKTKTKPIFDLSPEQSKQFESGGCVVIEPMDPQPISEDQDGILTFEGFELNLCKLSLV